MWKNKLYEFTCYPNGLAICPRKFTKLLKPIFSILRKQGHISVGYIDDSWLMGETFVLCVNNVIDILISFDETGFVVHPEKSDLLPSQVKTFLGFVLNSLLMQVSLTPKRMSKLKDACENLLATVSPTIREAAGVLDLMTSSFPGVMYGPLYYRYLEMDKTESLKLNKGNFDSTMTLSQQTIKDVAWWINSLPIAFNKIRHGASQCTMTTDASFIGWGCCLNTVTAGGN